MRLYRALGEDLLDNFVLVAGAELVLKLRLGCCVQDTLLAVPVTIVLAVVPLTITLIQSLI